MPTPSIPLRIGHNFYFFYVPPLFSARTSPLPPQPPPGHPPASTCRHHSRRSACRRHAPPAHAAATLPRVWAVRLAPCRAWGDTGRADPLASACARHLRRSAQLVETGSCSAGADVASLRVGLDGPTRPSPLCLLPRGRRPAAGVPFFLASGGHFFLISLGTAADNPSFSSPLLRLPAPLLPSFFSSSRWQVAPPSSSQPAPTSTAPHRIISSFTLLPSKQESNWVATKLKLWLISIP